MEKVDSNIIGRFSMKFTLKDCITSLYPYFRHYPFWTERISLKHPVKNPLRQTILIGPSFVFIIGKLLLWPHKLKYHLHSWSVQVFLRSTKPLKSFIQKYSLISSFQLTRYASRGQFHQPTGAKRKCAGCHSFAQAVILLRHSVSPTNLRLTLLVHRTRKSAQLLRCTLCAIRQ